MKALIITFFDMEGTVHLEFIPQDQTVNQAYYVEILKRSRETMRRKRPEFWPNDWILHLDHAPAHTALPIIQFLAQKSITEMGHLSSSPYLAPNDFWLFPEIKYALKGRIFLDIKDIQEKNNKKSVKMTQKVIPHQEFQKCFQQWQRRLPKCIAAHGEYFEGDPSQ
jgi:hypothetical protein